MMAKVMTAKRRKAINDAIDFICTALESADHDYKPYEETLKTLKEFVK